MAIPYKNQSFLNTANFAILITHFVRVKGAVFR